jgi:phytol kinase
MHDVLPLAATHAHFLPPVLQRGGRREELLRGPLLYAFVHVAVTLLCWRTSPGGVLALSVLCGGDGLAEVVGRSCKDAADAWRKNRAAGRKRRGSSDADTTSLARNLVNVLAQPLPYNSSKTVGGSLACWLGGAAVALPLLLHFQGRGLLPAASAAAAALPTGWNLVQGTLVCAAAGAAMESLPLIGEYDNLTVTLAVAVCSRICFGF